MTRNAPSLPVLDAARHSSGASPVSRLDLALVCDRDGLAGLRLEWMALFERCCLPQQVFQAFDWLWLWSLHYGETRTRLVIVTGRVEGRLAMVWPLVSRPVAWFRIVSFMGEPVSQYGDAIVDPALSDTDLDAALAYVLRLPAAVISLRRVRADAAIAPLLRRHFGEPANAAHAPFVDFAGAPDRETFERRYTGKVRSGRRRHLRRLEEHGPVRFETHGPSPTARALVRQALAFKRAWAQRRGAIAPSLADPRFERFFLAAASGEGVCPPLRVTTMFCADVIVGVEISIACKGRMFGHVLAPAPEFERLGVGGLLAGHAVLSALDQGFALYDTLAPADSYKLQWTDTTVAVGDYAIGRGLVGSLYVRLWLNWGRSAAKRFFTHLRPRSRPRREPC